MRRDHSAPDISAESTPPNSECGFSVNEDVSSDRADRHNSIESPPPELGFLYCPFYRPPKPGQPLSDNTRSLCWLADRFFGDMREFGITIQLHPDDIDRIVGRVLANKPMAQ